MVSRYRWRILALLFFATTINYVDRNVLSFVMADDGFRREMLCLEPNTVLTSGHHQAFLIEYGKVDALFKLAYAIGFVLMGWFIDKVGLRIGYAVSIGMWTLSAALHSTVNSFAGLRFFRATLGIGEAGNYPSAIKTVAEWFPLQERSKAIGIFNSGANIGIIFTAAVVPVLILAYNWRVSFLVTSSFGLLLLIFWLTIYRSPSKHDHRSSGKLPITQFRTEVQNSGKSPGWFQLLRHRQTWAFAAGKFCTDMVWFFYLGFLPDFFNKSGKFAIDLKGLSLPFIIIFLVSDAGSIFFGWLSSWLIKKDWSANKARKRTLFFCALCAVPVFFAGITSSIYVAVALVALAAAGHQGWSTTLFSTVTDMFPKQIVSSISGIGGMFGAIGGMLFSYNAGFVAASYGYFFLFVLASLAYLFALIVIHLLVPKLEPANI